nr:hypothetical protein [Limosilactobacillus coleohominis]
MAKQTPIQLPAWDSLQ